MLIITGWDGTEEQLTELLEQYIDFAGIIIVTK